MNRFKTATIALVLGGILGYGLKAFLSAHDMHAMGHGPVKVPSSGGIDAEPLYWVAPMDPNYKRDKPGKSPMGMDLIPVYEDTDKKTAEKPGTVQIEPAVENNLGVKTAPVARVFLSADIETVGYIAFDESQLWQTNVRVAGWVERLFINAVGEKVKKGDVLFTLYSPELVKAQEELLNAHKGKREVLIKGATERLVSLGVDRTQIKRIIAAGRASQTIEIKAIGEGIIATLNVREGGYISPAQTVISAGPLDEVWVDAEVFERQAHWMKEKTPAIMTLDGLPGKKWQGEIDYVYPILDPKTRTLRMRLKFKNSNGDLKPNMFANIALAPLSQNAVLSIPKNAVIRSGGMTRVVLSEGNGKYRSARVEIGREAGEQIEVLQGLTEHDRVVVSAHFLLDSESSLTADLSRMDGAAPKYEKVWGSGIITDVMPSHQMIRIHHDAVPKWQWPSMEMDFMLGEGVEMDGLHKGGRIDFEMHKTPTGQYQIVDHKKSRFLSSKAPLEGGEKHMHETMKAPDVSTKTALKTPVIHEAPKTALPSSADAGMQGHEHHGGAQ